MEPPTNLPRRATTLTRLWRSTDAADSIVQFLPTEALSALPKIAKSFERDHWRLLGALMRRAKRGTAAACKSAVLSTLQMCGHDNTLHLREDWADQARFSENWTMTLHRRNGELEHVDYTATVSRGTLVLDRMTPKNLTTLASGFNIPGAGDRCCIHRFGVSLTYTANDDGTIDSNGSGFQLLSIAERTRITLLLVYIAYEDDSFHLRWRNGFNIQTLKSVPNRHTFLVDATLDWRTGMARVRVDGAEIEQPLTFRPVPVSVIYLKSGEYPGQSTFGPFDVWYSNMPPPPPCVRFEGDP